MNGTVEEYPIKNRFEREITLFKDGFSSNLTKFTPLNAETGYEYTFVCHLELFTDVSNDEATECEYPDVSSTEVLLLTDTSDNKFAYAEVVGEPQKIKLEANTEYDWAKVTTVYNGKPCVMLYIKTLWPDV